VQQQQRRAAAFIDVVDASSLDIGVPRSNGYSSSDSQDGLAGRLASDRRSCVAPPRRLARSHRPLLTRVSAHRLGRVTVAQLERVSERTCCSSACLLSAKPAPAACSAAVRRISISSLHPSLSAPRYAERRAEVRSASLPGAVRSRDVLPASRRPSRAGVAVHAPAADPPRTGFAVGRVEAQHG
jgi:hypothetical protein